MIFCFQRISLNENSKNFAYIQNGKMENQVKFTPDNDIKMIKYISADNNCLFNYPDGYSICYPNDMQVDVSLSAAKTVLFDQATKIEIYRDNFAGTIHNAQDYVNYSNRCIECSENYVQTDKIITVNKMKVHLLQWQRAPLDKVINDKRFYLSAEFIKNDKEVYTVLIKSCRPVDRFLPYLESFKTIPARGTARINSKYTYQSKAYNQETSAFYKKYFSPHADLRWGIFQKSALTNNMEELKTLENELGYSFYFLVWYKSLGSPFPLQELQTAYKNHKYVELTLQYPVSQNLTYDILNGKYDAYLRDYALQLKKFGHPVLLRLNNEMNGEWCSYSSIYSSKDTDLFREVWQHIYILFKQEGADNALWVWNPNDKSFPGFKWNDAINYFPGDDYVDIIGLTGYNTGTYYPGEVWRNFDDIYKTLYSAYNGAFDYPFMITEFGCNNIGGDKKEWIKNMFNQMKKFNRIKAAIWFNSIDLDNTGKPARTYRIDKDKVILQTFSNGLRSYPSNILSKPVEETGTLK